MHMSSGPRRTPQTHGRLVHDRIHALCGFANFLSIAIQIGGLGVLAPSRKGDVPSRVLALLAARSPAS